MLKAEPLNTRTAGTDTNTLTTFTLLLVIRTQRYMWSLSGQRWMQFELQNSPSRAFAIDGKIDTTFQQICKIALQLNF